MRVIKDGNAIDMSYEDICEALGFIPSVHFVEVTKRGTIEFTLGKPHEIKSLYRAINENGFKPTRKMVECVESL